MTCHPCFREEKRRKKDKSILHNDDLAEVMCRLSAFNKTVYETKHLTTTTTAKYINDGTKNTKSEKEREFGRENGSQRKRVGEISVRLPRIFGNAGNQIIFDVQILDSRFYISGGR